MVFLSLRRKGQWRVRTGLVLLIIGLAYALPKLGVTYPYVLPPPIDIISLLLIIAGIKIILNRLL